MGDGYVIRNVGTANPIVVRDRTLAQGESAPLAPGDVLRIGGYIVEVAGDASGGDERTTVDTGGAALDPFAPIAAQTRPAPAPAMPTRSVPPAYAPPMSPSPASSPFADLGMPVSAGNPFAELLGNAPPQRASMPSTSSMPAATSPSNRLPDDFDPFAPPPPPSASPRQAPTPPSMSGFEDLVPNAAPASIDALFDLAPTSSADPLAAFLADAKPQEGDSSARGAPVSTDPLAMFGNAGDVRPRPVAETLPDQAPELRAAFVPPRPMPPIPAKPRPAAVAPTPPPPKAPPVPPAAARPPPPATAPPPAVEETTAPPLNAAWTPEALAVWTALCEGAGVKLDPPPNSGPNFMRVIGMMLRASVEGTVQLMAMRSATRQELQAQVTVIRPKNNNPLKFAADAQSAMEQLLQPAVRGFLPGPAAVTDAMHDLLGHAIGTMAGTRAALEGVLKRFGPQELEAKLASKSMLDSVLPMNRKAKLWELYLQHHETIRDEAQEDFHTLFGRAFLAAYEQQLERLRREKAAAGR